MNLNIVCLLGILISSSVALAHGSLEWPKSRVKHIYDAMNQTPRPVWAAQAIALDGEQSYYTWNQMSRNFPSAIQGNPQAYYDQIPDGQLASAGNLPATARLPSHPGLSFSGLDTVSPSWLWPATPVSAGPREFTFYATATHDPSFFKVWISKQGYNPQTELRWQDLESLGQPAHTRTGNNYYFTVNLPERTGRAVVYVAWQRVDPVGEVFYALSDVDYGGGTPTGDPFVGLASATANVSENAGTASIPVALSRAVLAAGVTVNYSLSAGTAGAGDFSVGAGTLNFAAGETQKTIVVPITNDAIQESAEIFLIQLSAPVGAVLGQSTNQVTISDDDVPAGASGYRFIVSQNWGSGWEGRLELYNGSAAAWNPWSLEFDAPWTISSAYDGVINSRTGNHYTCGPQSWNQQVNVGSTLIFGWLVSNAGTHGTVAPSQVRINGQLLPQLSPAVAIDSLTLDEGDNAHDVSLAITLESAHTAPISVAWQTLPGTAGASDVTMSQGTVTFAPGETSKTIVVSVLGDFLEETAETFSVTLAGVENQLPPRFVTGKQTAVITMRDDDGPASVWLTGGTVQEGNSGARDVPFTAWLSRAPKLGEIVSLDYATVNETAVAADASMASMGMECQCRKEANACDFNHRQGTLVIPPGTSSANLPVVVKGDLRDEELEVFQLRITNLVGCIARNTTATAQIIDDDLAGKTLGGNRRVIAYADATAGTVTLPPADRITHLFAAFANVGNDGTLTSVPQISSWNSLKSTNPQLRILLSIGGWNWSSNFPAMAADSVKRATFAQSCRSVVLAQNLDGIDLDWEWPGGGNTVPIANDRNNFTALVRAVRVALDELSNTTGKTYELTCYAPASAANIAHWDLAALKQDFDFFNVQGYDLHGPWDSITGHQSGLLSNPSKDDGLSIAEVLALYTTAGVAKSQLLVGAPFYGYYWTNVGPNQNGFNQPGGGASDLTYAALSAANSWARSFVRTWDPYSLVPSLQEITAQGNGRWVSYDDPQSLHAKAAFSRAHGYGGVFFWQLGGDTADRSLLTTLSDSMADYATTDSDADGLPDAWEMNHFSTLSSANGSSDSDGDGSSDLLEFRGRTLPHSGADFPCLHAERHANQSVMLHWSTAHGVSYQLQRSYDLSTWQEITTIQGSGADTIMHDSALPANTAKAFYRLVFPPLPAMRE